MAEDCRIAHVGEAHAHDDHHAASDGPLSEIARVKASRRSFIKGVIASGATLGATGYQLVTDYFASLEGFDHAAVVKAMGSTQNAFFPVWRKAW